MRRPGIVDPRLKNLIAWVFLVGLLAALANYAYGILAPASQDPSATKKDLKPDASSTTNENGSELEGRIRVKVSGLNLRSSPEKGKNRVGLLKKGTVLEVRGRNGEWYEVEAPDGTRGYVSSDLKYVQILELTE